MHELALPSEYVIERPIGQGSFGKTYLALDTRTQAPCVVKQLFFSQAADWKTIELFEREARVLAQLDHPRIPEFLGFHSQNTGSDHQACLIQEFIPGRTLKELVNEGKRFSEAEVLRFCEDLLEVLVYLQHFSPPVIHRDIKPSNVIISPEGEAHLVDFGAVTENLLNRDSGGSTIVGTFGYMAPEQLDGRAVPGSDLYALGATLIFAASGLEPNQMEKENLSLNFRPYVQLSEAFCLWLEKLTHPDWKQRFQTAQEALFALKRRHAPANIASKKSSNRPLVMFGIAALGVCLGVQLYIYRSESPMFKVLAVGTIVNAGKPPAPLPAMEPRFWFQDRDSGQRVQPGVEHQDGEFKVRNLDPGHYGLNVAYDLNPANPLQYPGDLRAWETFTVEPGQAPVKLKLNLIRLLHLTAPVDNNRPVASWGRQCQDGAQAGDISPSQPIKFSWESLGPGVSYDYEILRVTCGNPTSSQTVAGGLTKDNHTPWPDFKLPESPKNSYYVFRLEAQAGNQVIGRLRTHSAEDHDWHYPFRVR